MKQLIATLAVGLCAAIGTCQSAFADNYTGQVITTAASYCPQGMEAMEGQLVSIQAYSALYTLLGTTYGGDGHSTFALPDTRGSLIVGEGNVAPTWAARGTTGVTGVPAAGGVPTVVLRHCIVMDGLFPSR